MIPALFFIALAAAQEGTGLAAKYPEDAGIGKDPKVVFADDFEGWEPGTAKFPEGTWDSQPDKEPVKRQRAAVGGKVSIDGREGPGKNVLLLACWKGGAQSASFGKLLGNYRGPNDGKGPGYEELYVRYYVKFDAAYTPVQNHGANLGGRDVTRQGSWWVGQAASRDVSANGYFYSGLQPYEAGPTRMYWGFYSYHMDKKGVYGDHYSPKDAEKSWITVDRWTCVERRMKLNSADPVKADGMEELWVDGKLAIRREGLRFRQAPALRISFFGLDVYYHNLPDKYTEQNPCKVTFDHLVIATEPIGPIAPKKP